MENPNHETRLAKLEKAVATQEADGLAMAKAILAQQDEFGRLFQIVAGIMEHQAASHSTITTLIKRLAESALPDWDRKEMSALIAQFEQYDERVEAIIAELNAARAKHAKATGLATPPGPEVPPA